MTNKKSNAGRPKKEKDPNSKQFNVTIPGEVQDNEMFKERTKFMTVSQYVNSLIHKDIQL